MLVAVCVCERNVILMRMITLQEDDKGNGQ